MRVELFNCPIDAITLEDTIEKINEAIKSKNQIHHVVVNVAKLVHMQKNKVLKESVVHCDIINADGQGVVLAARLLGKKIPERVTGIDLMESIVKMAYEKKYKIYFFGAEELIVQKVVEKYRNLYSLDIVAGFRNGYYNIEDESKIAIEIANSKPNILFVAMGSPKKENFLYTNKAILKEINLIMGVGGSFDVIAGKVRRAPNWVQKVGMEWFFRMCQEPRRLFKRYFVTNLALIKLIVVEKVNQLK